MNHVSKQFEDGKFALDEVSLQIKKGEFVTILGPSGCGKTTLLRCIAGFQVATEGDILLNGEDVTTMPPHLRDVNTVFQKYALFPHLNVFDNVAFGLKLKKEDTEVDVVVRPEDIYIGALQEGKEDNWQLHGEVHSCIFKGVHYEMTVLTDEGYELMIQDYHAFEPGTKVGLLVKPEDIQVMKKERLCNTFDGEVLEDNRVRFLDEEWDIPERVAERFEVGEEVEVEVDFNRVNLQDDEEDGVLCGEVYFILYKGDHYHLTVRTDDGDDIFVDTNDVWVDGYRLGIRVAPSYIRLY